MKKFVYIFIILFSLSWGCNDADFLDREPTNILIDDQIWGDNSLILSVVADLYDRIPEFQTISNWWNYVGSLFTILR